MRQGGAVLQGFAVRDGGLRLTVGMLTRTNQLHLMIAYLQAVDQAAQRHRHAIDLGRIGLGHHRNAQLRVSRRQSLAGEFGCIHGAEHAPGMRQKYEAGVTVW